MLALLRAEADDLEPAVLGDAGRLRVGLASGDSALRNIGVRAASVAELDAYVRAVQELTAGVPR